nr:T9SS type A sorting domain-containing protein [Bacteroidota bacterium]
YKHVRLEATPKVCDPTLLPKWNKQGQVAMTPYLEFCYNRYNPQNYSTPLYQSKWMTHNIYNSLLTTDQYVWTYIESMNFWTAQNAPPDVNVFLDIETAVRKFRNDEALGYDMYNTGSGMSQFITSPTIKITAPANNSFINTAGNITITADVNPTSSIARVEFYANSLKIGEKLSAPYSITNYFLKENYTVFARVFKTDGTHNSSGPVNLIANIVTGVFKMDETSTNIYPNPAKTELIVTGDLQQNTNYEIISILGKTVRTGALRESVISIEGLSAGVYILKIKSDAGETVQRFVKE